MTNAKFNWGLIAPGRIARNFAEALAVIPDAHLYAVASSNLARAQAFAEEFSGEHALDDYQLLVNDPAVDAVYIANPHRFHYDCIKMCLAAGKPVLCEKPLTVNAAQTQELIALAEQNKVFLMEALWSRFQPAWRQVREWLEQQKIGEIKLLSSTFGVNVPRNNDDRLLNPELAGGVLLDMGVYNVSMSQYVMQQRPVKILAEGVVGETGVDERCSVTMSYGEAASQFTCNFMSNTENSFTIYGSKGFIRIPGMFWVASQACLQLEGQPAEVFESPFRASGFEYQIEEVMQCVRAGKLQSDIISWQESLTTMQIMDEIRSQVGVRYAFLGE
jgi:predicted dehydrogenase